MKHTLTSLFLILFIASCAKKEASRITQVDVKLLDRSGRPIAGKTVWENFSFKTVPDPSVGLPPYPLYYSEPQITNAAGIAIFLIADSVFRYQSLVKGIYGHEYDSSGTPLWRRNSASLSKGSFLELTFQEM